jgi:serine/threonine protein phosphatase 1
MRNLPTIFRDETRGLVFVHGGIDPKVFPQCSDEIRLWTRSQKFFDPGRWPDRPELEGVVVVHGHTPTRDFAPHMNARRINVDTGACFGGPLTSVVLAPGLAPRFLRAS